MNLQLCLQLSPVNDESSRIPWQVALLWVIALKVQGVIPLRLGADTFTSSHILLLSPIPAKQVAGFKSPLSEWSLLSAIAHQRPVLLQNID